MSQPAAPLPHTRPFVAAILTALLTAAAVLNAAPPASAATGASVSGAVSTHGDTAGYTLTRDGWGADVTLHLAGASNCLVRTTLVVASGANVSTTVGCSGSEKSFHLEAGYGTAIKGVSVTLISGWRSTSSGTVPLPEPPIDADSTAIAFAAMQAGKSALAGTGMITTTDGCSVPAELSSLVGDLGDLSTTFYDACVVHDFGYWNLGGVDGYSPTDATRAQVDALFLNQMLMICSAEPTLDRASCQAGAYAFYSAVRIGGGGPFYD